MSNKHTDIQIKYIPTSSKVSEQSGEILLVFNNAIQLIVRLVKGLALSSERASSFDTLMLVLVNNNQYTYHIYFIDPS